MKVAIHSLALGIARCFVIQGEGVIMVDGGASNQTNRFVKEMARISMSPEEIQLIVITHGHPDHIGSAKEISALKKLPESLKKQVGKERSAS